MSLRKVSNGRVEERGIFFRKWLFHTTKTNYYVLHSGEYEHALAERDSTGVAKIGQDGGRVLWWADSGLYWADRELSAENVALLIWDRQRRQDAKLDRLRTIREQGEEVSAARRRGIPADVRAHVWQRDAGRCQKCGNRNDLQFDHIIPVSKGGGNSAKNIQLLCGDCNRRKGNSIIE